MSVFKFVYCFLSRFVSFGKIPTFPRSKMDALHHDAVLRAHRQYNSEDDICCTSSQRTVSANFPGEHGNEQATHDKLFRERHSRTAVL